MFYQTDRTQAAVSVDCRHPVPLGYNAMVPYPAACGLKRTAHAFQCIVSEDDSAVFRFFVPGDFDLDLDIQTHPREGSNTSSL